MDKETSVEGMDGRCFGSESFCRLKKLAKDTDDARPAESLSHCSSICSYLCLTSTYTWSTHKSVNIKSLIDSELFPRICTFNISILLLYFAGCDQYQLTAAPYAVLFVPCLMDSCNATAVAVLTPEPSVVFE